ncbi:MAG: hypothetical protein ABIE68_00410 [bacterium]
MNKKLLIAIIIIIVTLIFVAIAVYIISNRNSTSETNTNTDGTSGELTLAEEGDVIPRNISDNNTTSQVIEETEKSYDFGKVTEKAAKGAWTSDGKTFYYYDEAENQFYKANADGTNPKEISNAVYLPVSDIQWSTDGKMAAFSLKDKDGNYREIILNLETGAEQVFVEEVKNVTFSPDGSKIAYQYYDPDNNVTNISVADPDGTNWKVIKEVGIQNPSINWYQSDYIGYWNKGTGSQGNSIYSVNLDGSFNVVTSEGYGTDAKWSPDGSRLVYSRTGKRSSTLYLFTSKSNGENEVDLKTPTLASKCAFASDNKTVYCAVPDFISQNAIMPDDYFSGKVLTRDSFIKIDSESGSKTQIAHYTAFEQPKDATNLNVSPDQKTLYFTARNDGKAYSLPLE